MNKHAMVWMDLEMTGLDPEQDRILEIATLISDENLNIIAEGPNLIIHQSEDILAKMNPWCIEHHAASGLSDKVRQSTISLAEAEQQTLAFIRQYLPKARVAPLCGNSIHQDRRFLVQYMPTLEAHLHYRNIDVSTLKELARRWYPKLAEVEKKASHRALDDIHESLRELHYYRQHIFHSSI